MKPIFTIHEGEFLVGDFINRKLVHKFDTWVPTKDSGVDILVTRNDWQGKAVGLQVKFSRDFSGPGVWARGVIAGGWFTLDKEKIRRSKADLWVFAIMTLRHEQHFVVIPKWELLRRIPRHCGKIWHIYLNICSGGKCYQVRGLKKSEQLDAVRHGVKGLRRDFSAFLEKWVLLDKFTGKKR